MIKNCLGLLCFSLWVLSVLCIELLPYNPVANPSAVVVSGNARFTVLTSNIIRMEYAKSGKFEDRATVAFVNRNVPVPTFTKTINSTYVVIKTSALELKYQVGSVFSKTSLTITGLDSTAGFSSWYYGQPNPRNLLGTIKSLDLLGVTSLNCDEVQNVIVNGESLHCEWGLISRDGWTVVNDTTNYGLDNTFWWDSPNTDDLDLYFFGHGLNYKQALSEYILLGGKIAMVPRYIYGIAWSRWYNLNNIDVTSIVNEYTTRYLPLDVYILDMDWHVKYAWGSYTWDKRLFPHPENILGWLQSQGLAVSANLHDADGVHSYEDKYTQMCNALGINPSSGQPIIFSSVNATYLRAIDDVVLGPIMDQGMDFWWLDWQEGGTTGGCTGQKQNPTYILNHLRSTYHLRHNHDVRGLVLARWGGLGTHRYQVGFSGDVAALTWANLAFQPYFSWTASNVGYGFWSHDIVGPVNNHELHTRWVQWGAYSGIFRTHDRGLAAGDCSDTGSCAIVEVWKVPDPYFSANRAAMLERASLIPYIYTAARQAYDTGISLIRPMYYEYPQFDIAYKGDQNGNFGQYFFGDDMFVSPVTTPANANTSMATSTIWIPPGIWIEKDTGVMLNGASDGSTILTKSFDLTEIPVFIRGGAIIPKISLPPGNTIGTARRQYTTLRLQIYPGQTSGSTNLYEDDGMSVEYLTNKYTWTQISYQRTATTLQIVIATPNGTFPEFPTARNYIIEVINGLPITSGTVNGNPLAYSSFDVPNSWRYDGDHVTLRVLTPILPTNNPVTIVLNTPAINDKLMSGFKGAIQKSILAKRNLDPDWATPGASSVSGGYLELAASAAFELSYLAGTNINNFYQVLNTFPQLFLNATNEIMGIKPIPPPPAGSLVQLWDADRQDNVLCGSPDCLNDNSQYQYMRIEGYQPSQGPDVVSLNDFWNDNINDNYATTQTTTPNGYSAAAFSDGLVYSSSKPGTVPLSVWWNSQREDMLTVASAEGIAYAKQNGYTLVNAAVGYVLTSPPGGKGSVPLTRWSYSMELLNNALN